MHVQRAGVKDNNKDVQKGDPFIWSCIHEQPEVRLPGQTKPNDAFP